MAARSTAAATCLSAPGSAAASPSLAPSTALGTGEGPLRYRICVPCSKRPPPVRDASSKARRTADSTDCGQPPATLDAFQRRAVPKAAPAHRTHLQCAKRPPLSLFAPAPSTIFFVPLTRNLSPADPSPAPSTALGTGNGPRSKTRRTAPARR